MKEIEFPQTDLRNLFFFTKSDVLLISSLTMLTIWDFTKLNIVNKIDFVDPKLNVETLHELDFYNIHDPSLN